MLLAGVPTMTDYREHVQSQSFLEMEKFSDSFLATNSDALSTYSQKWVGDPLHQWSRQWEYSFVYERIERFLADIPESKARALDAGSGVTFFPYYLRSQLQCDVQCVDSDESFDSIYGSVNSNVDSEINFRSADISALPFDDGSFQVVYCISVLEHTEQYPAIIREFHRVLDKPGLLVVTFDISIDGDRDIPLEGAERLLGELNEVFPDSSLQEPISLGSVVGASDALTTKAVGKYDKQLLPWRNPVVSALSSIRKGQLPTTLDYPNLTCYCEALRKS